MALVHGAFSIVNDVNAVLIVFRVFPNSLGKRDED